MSRTPFVGSLRDMTTAFMSPAVRTWLPPTAALALAVLLLFHPTWDDRVYVGLRDQATPFLIVHIGLAIGAGLMAAAAYLLTAGLRSRAATVSRLALAPFVVFFIAWEATLGIGTGILVDQANGLPAAERAPVAEAIQDYFESPVLLGLSAIGNTAWVVAMSAAAVAFRQAGASWKVTLLVAASSLFVLHDAGPIGAIGLACFAASAVLMLRSPDSLAAPAGARSELADARPLAGVGHGRA